MKIVISPEEEDDFEEIIYENITQVIMAGTLMRQKIAPAIFRRSFISDANELIGLCEALKEDLRDHKRYNGNSTRKS